MFVAKLPGSTYATEATNAGPSIASVARSRPRASSRSSGLGPGAALPTVIGAPSAIAPSNAGSRMAPRAGVKR